MEGREWVSLGGVAHVDLSEGFLRLTDFPVMCEAGAHSMTNGHHRI